MQRAEGTDPLWLSNIYHKQQYGGSDLAAKRTNPSLTMWIVALKKIMDFYIASMNTLLHQNKMCVFEVLIICFQWTAWQECTPQLLTDSEINLLTWTFFMDSKIN